MKVLQLGKFYPIMGGVEKVMYDLTYGLSQQGIACDMLCTNTHVGDETKIVDINAHSSIICTKTFLKKFSTTFSVEMALKLKRICANYNIIHVHHPDPMAAFALWLSGYKGKVVLHWHSDILSQKMLLYFYLPLQRWLIQRANLIVGTTPVYIQSSPFLKEVQHKCTFLPIGIEPVTCTDDGVERIKARYGHRKIVFSLGRLVTYKGFEYLIDAASLLPDDYVVLIGGSGELHQSLTHQIQSLHLEDKVHLLGRVSDEDLPYYYEACDAYCLSSIMKTEAFAIVQIEAMSCGKPIVATKIPGSGVAWVNAHDVSGINVGIRDGAAIANALTTILEDAELYQRYSSGAKARYEELFKREKMIAKCINQYRNL